MTARPQLRRGRLAHLEQLDHQRPRVRLERLPPPRHGREPEALWVVGCFIGGAIVTAISLLARGCA